MLAFTRVCARVCLTMKTIYMWNDFTFDHMVDPNISTQAVRINYHVIRVYGIEVAKRDLAHVFKSFHIQRDSYVLYNIFLTHWK